MKALKQRFPTLFLSLAELIVGILLLINPTAFTNAIIVLAGIILAVVGVLKILPYFRKSNDVSKTTLTTGIIELVAGILLIACSGMIITLLDILTTLFGVAILIVGLSKIGSTVRMAKAQVGNWIVMVISTALTIICGVLIIVNPFDAVSTLWIFIGITLIVEAVLDLLSQFLKKGGSSGSGPDIIDADE